MNKLIFMIGESGSGKTTLQNKMISNYPDKYINIVSTTTRKPRDKEVNGKDYNFTDENSFSKLDLLQYVKFGENYYGTELKEFEKTQEVGLFIATPEGVYDTINGLKEKDIELDYEIMFFMTSKNLLKKHNVPKERVERGNIQEDFIKRYTEGEFKDLYVHILSDNDIHRY